MQVLLMEPLKMYAEDLQSIILLSKTEVNGGCKQPDSMF